LCAPEVADLTETPDGLRVPIRRSKGDQEGQGQEIAIPRGYQLRPVDALQGWLDAAEISTGAVFRSVALGGRVGERLNPESAARIIKGYAERLGLDPVSFAGHSRLARSAPGRQRSGRLSVPVQSRAHLG
jgi:hypothetical protein